MAVAVVALVSQLLPRGLRQRVLLLLLTSLLLLLLPTRRRHGPARRDRLVPLSRLASTSPRASRARVRAAVARQRQVTAAALKVSPLQRGRTRVA